MKTLLLLFLLVFNICGASVNFVHIPKTGGQTIRSLLDSNFGDSQIYPYPYTLVELRRVKKIPLKQLPIIHHEVAKGHLPMWFFLKKDPDYETSYFFTVLRDPVERVLSSDRYRVRNGKWQVSNPLAVQPNLMCKFLCSDSNLQGKARLANCIKTLERMNYIIFMDDFENGVRNVFNELGLNLPESIPRLNTTVPQPVSDEMIEKIKALNSLDVQLYEYAKEHFR